MGGWSGGLGPPAGPARPGVADTSVESPHAPNGASACVARLLRVAAQEAACIGMCVLGAPPGRRLLQKGLGLPLAVAGTHRSASTRVYVKISQLL